MLLSSSAAVASVLATSTPAIADEGPVVICDAECAAAIAGKEPVVLPSGLRYIDIKEGTGVSPVVGFQVTAHYVVMTTAGKVFYSSKDGDGAPKDFRVGADAVVAGLDEGVRTMRSGGVRRLFVPGNMGFPKGLPAGPGRPRVMPGSEVIFDVELLLVPGLDDEE